MLKLFKFTCGTDDKVGAFKDDEDAYERRAEVDPTFHFLPVTIEEMTIEGYEITITPIEEPADPATESVPPAVVPAKDEFDDMEKEALQAWLRGQSVEFHPQLGEKKLRDLCRNTMSAQANAANQSKKDGGSDE